MGRVPNLQFETLAAFVQTIIAPGSVIYADGADGYEKLGDLLDANGNPLYTVCTTNIKASGVKAHKVLPRVHMVASHFKRWWQGTLHGSVRNEYLDYYCDEYTFRFNRRRAKHRGLLFYCLLQQAVLIGHTAGDDLVGSLTTNQITLRGVYSCRDVFDGEEVRASSLWENEPDYLLRVVHGVWNALDLV